jgi:hypothetical protein
MSPALETLQSEVNSCPQVLPSKIQAQIENIAALLLLHVIVTVLLWQDSFRQLISAL